MEKNKYTNSMINNYGYPEKVSEDIKTLNDIISRQGNNLLLHVIAESCGITANKFNLNDLDRSNLVRNTIEVLKDALQERV